MEELSFYKNFENIYAHSSVPWQQDILRDFFTKIGRRGELSVLDVGAGIGNNIETIADFAAEIIATDISPEALGVLGRRHAHLRDIQTRCADVASLPFADGTFDVLVMTEVIEHCADPESALKECWRVLKPGGFLIVSSPNYLNAAGLRKWLREHVYPRKEWDAWGTHDGGRERFTTTLWLRRLVAGSFGVIDERGGDVLRGWFPFLRGHYEFIDRHPFLQIGKMPLARFVLMNYFMLAKKPNLRQ